jgi:hypothetical protein
LREVVMRRFWLALALPIGVAACDPPVSCQTACQRAFRENECNLRVPGRQANRLVRDCTRECENALTRTGDLDGYDPNDRNSVDRSQPFRLQNEKQAAVWIDCVLETSCEDLNRGFCPGGGIN